MEPDNEEYEYEEEENSGNSNTNSNFKLKGIKGLTHKANKAAKEGTKKAFKTVFSNASKKIFAALFSKPVLIFLAVLAVAILIFAIVWYVVSVNPHTELVSSVDSYITNSSNISTKAQTMYEQTGSLLYLTDEDIKAISDDYLESLEKTNSLYYKEVSKKGVIGDHKISEISYANGFNITNAYEFMLSAEKLNFNRVTWEKYDRETGEVEELETQVDEETNLIYPKNDEDKEKGIEYFTNILVTYLQSYVVPSSMASGVVAKGDTTNVVNFAFQIVDQAYHEITVRQYTLHTAKRDQTKKHYLAETATVAIYKKTYKCSDSYSDNFHAAIGVEEEEEEKLCTAYGYYADEVQAKMTSLAERYNAAKSQETEKVEVYKNTEKQIEKQFVYPVIKAYVLKETMDISYYQNKYNEEDVANFVEEDTKYVTATEGFSNVSGLEGLQPITGTGWTLASSATISMETGEYITTRFAWNDKLEQKVNTISNYGVGSVMSFAGTSLTESEKAYYTELEEEKELTRIDLINAVPEIYEDYLNEDENYSEHIGFSRAYLSLSFNLLNKHLSELNIRAATTNWAGLSIGSITGLDMIWPLDYYGSLSSTFGEYRPSIGQFYGHRGIDITPSGNYAYPSKSSYTGSYVYAASSGTVVEMYKETPRDQGNAASKCPDTAQGANYSCGGVSTYGRHIKIKDINGYTVVYGHLYEIADGIEVGSQITQGQVLGVMGTTGSSTGVHLHFEVRDSSGMVVDPLKIVGVSTAREILKK